MDFVQQNKFREKIYPELMSGESTAHFKDEVLKCDLLLGLCVCGFFFNSQYFQLVVVFRAVGAPKGICMKQLTPNMITKTDWTTRSRLKMICESLAA